jgi:hypothetical protein
MPAAFLYFADERRLNLYFKFSWYCLLALLVGTSYRLGQLPSDCDSVETQGAAFSPTASSEQTSAGPRVRQASENPLSIAENWNVGSSCSRPEQIDSLVSTQNTSRGGGFHWGRALLESFTFLSIEQAYVVHDDYRWVTSENGIPFNHYWRDYKQSLHTWVNSGWDDGDAVLYSYVGRPIQGALTEYNQIQNDPKGRDLELSNTKQYWHSRLKALAWNAVYSTQWNIGPLSELTVEKYGTADRTPWNKDGTWPCTRKPCVTGVGQVDLVMTPVGGFVWMLTEDFLDKEIARRVEGATRNHFLVDLTRCALNPIRGEQTSCTENDRGTGPQETRAKSTWLVSLRN